MLAPLVSRVAGFRYFYVSRVAPGVGPAGVTDILRVSRSFNRQHGISGALLFDGEHFAQWLEGEPAKVAALAARIEADPRHVDVDVRARLAGRSERRFTDWRCGWVELDCIAAALCVPPALPLDAQLAAFLALAGASDLA